MYRFLDLTQQLGGKLPYYLNNQMVSVDMIRHYWENIIAHLDIPKGEHDLLSIAVPFCYDCCTRSIIIDILTQQYGMAQCDIVPRPLALLMGFLAQHPQDDLNGDLLCILEEETNLDFSFISLNGSVITLEHQGRGSLEDLQTAAERLALFTDRGWEFNHLLYVNHSLLEEMYLTAFQSDPALHLIKLEDAHSTVLQGLHYSTLKGSRTVRIVYPYDFYLQILDSSKNGMVLKKIPFDTAHLELDLHGSYKIARLSSQDLDTHPEDREVEFAVYESARTPPLPEILDRPPAMVFRGLKKDLPDSLELWLNMAAANISLNSNSENTDRIAAQSAELWLRLQNSQRDLYKLLEGNANHHLKEDMLHSIFSPYDTRQDSLEKRLDMIRLKLYGLLQLYSTK